MKIIFASVFDNEEGHRVIEKLRNIKFERDHNYGHLEIDNVTKEELKVLRAKKIDLIIE